MKQIKTLFTAILVAAFLVTVSGASVWAADAPGTQPKEEKAMTGEPTTDKEKAPVMGEPAKKEADATKADEGEKKPAAQKKHGKKAKK
ncbi:MAG: hypothetical protein COV67_10380 [Nitrospinae bacterium CG11_big_fil_rev_8_21_14_0_20_56_8]|nr:MAG: hypothetical protein COV67_10380 [Nitrospinae bacterium CG11_big_fil_rev_8_21_14_0_20_56_8]